MKKMPCRSFLALLALSLLPFGLASAKTKSPAVVAENASQTATPPADAATIVYQGGAYALLPDCFGTAFVVGVDQTPVGQSDTILVAIPFPGGVSVLPPIVEAASGALAGKALNDAVCLQATA